MSIQGIPENDDKKSLTIPNLQENKLTDYKII
jgi:hypothetical protein